MRLPTHAGVLLLLGLQHLSESQNCFESSGNLPGPALSCLLCAEQGAARDPAVLWGQSVICTVYSISQHAEATPDNAIEFLVLAKVQCCMALLT